jgi:glutathione synthase/RimK-type ligase-like ATP-grasp enzyme
MRARVALATYDVAPELAPDDRPLVAALAAHDIAAAPAVWSDEHVDWTSFDAVIVRSCWDYHRRLDAFVDWLNRLDALAIPVWNQSSLLRWNSDKRYLLDLAERGVATVPTSIVSARATAADVETIALSRGWTHVVVKPAVSASGYETYALRVPFDDAARANVARAASHGSVLVQPFANEVPRDGELSFTFIDGVLSHATRKRAMAGEFRVQTEHGGSVEPATPDERVSRDAHIAIEALPQIPLYARVDGIVREGAFLLMELELIEPNLFLAYDDGAMAKFARAIAKRVAAR